MKILITGATGFVGPHLLTAVRAAHPEAELVATGHEPAGGEAPGVSWRQLDLADPEALEALAAEVRPAHVYHLAARSSVAASFQDPGATFAVNADGTLRLLEALRRRAPEARTLFISSAEVYGGASALPDEQAPFAPATPYAASKAAAEMVCLAAWRAFKQPVIRARAFNHTGPGQTADFVAGAFATQIARIEAGLQKPVVSVGNLEARRDFLDVRDVVAAYVALMASGRPGEVYNVASGASIRMRELLDGLLDHAKVSIAIRPDPERMRPSDVPELVGDAAKLRRETGWVPRYALETTLLDLLDEKRRAVAAEAAREARSC